ncbi:hypothetical protein FRE64_11765 [Euhalothece natronophila Z-M001]|uniref:Uncharacterized protein n=1 Tax=Euhalothece natronophila Z-M001 TaxID=522448 RepID=A0A5B8NPV9_9CHRO|nr:hypothetical protein [Euhalothece natronophila]QDZ40571.1 hypothetical protein FRE64_11765 [Euhalothece natronophila Z-M001]
MTVEGAECGFQSALDHYLSVGFQEGREGSNIPYDEAFYLNEHSDVLDAVENDDFGSGFEHFVLHGAEENRASTQELLEFDAESYLGANSDVEQAVEQDEMSSALEHWINFGAEEGRDLGTVLS